MNASSAAERASARRRTARELGECNDAVSAGHPDHAVDDFEIACRRLERIGGNLLEHRRQAFVAPSTEAPPHGIELDPPVPVPVAMRSVSPWIIRTRSGCKPKVIGDDLRIGGGVALAGRLRADQNGDAAVMIEAHARSVGPVIAAGLDIGREADAAQPSELARARQPPLEAVPVGELLRARHWRAKSPES